MIQEPESEQRVRRLALFAFITIGVAVLILFGYPAQFKKWIESFKEISSDDDAGCTLPPE